jgi:hypothetical protein
MRCAFLLAVAALAATLMEGAAGASEFDKCVLQHMQGVTSDLAAASIKEACLRTVETQLPEEAVKALAGATAAFGQLPSYVGGFGLYITLNNHSGYTITELSIEIENEKTHEHVTYAVRNFPFVPPPGAIMDPPRDPTIEKMIGPGQRVFYTPINQTTADVMKWHELFSWQITSVKGFSD